MNRSSADAATPVVDAEGEPAMDQRRMIASIAWNLFLDAGLAVGAYLLARALGADLFVALLVGTAVAAARAVYVIIRRREIDAFAIFMIITFGIGLVLTLITGSPRFLLAKDGISNAVSGLVFAVTLFFGKPMMFYLSQRFGATDDAERTRWRELWGTEAGFRAFFRMLTVVWTIAFLAEATVKIIMAMTLPVSVMAPILPFFTPVLITLLVVWTVRSSARGQQKLRAAGGAVAED